MPARKKATTNDKPQSALQSMQEPTCPTSSGASKLENQIVGDDTGEILLTVVSNTGGGFLRAGKWISFSDIQAAIEAWPADAPITSMAFAGLYRGKSANNPGFLTAVLVAEGLLEPLGCDSPAICITLSQLNTVW